MKLYKVNMPLYAPALAWEGTQDDAKACARANPGSTWEAVEVPTDKAGLLAWLNNNATFYDLERPTTEPEPSKPDVCPACKRTPAAQAKMAAGLDSLVLVERIMAAEGWELARLTEAVIERLCELKD